MGEIRAVKTARFEGEWEVTTFDSLLNHHSGDSTFIKGHLQGQPGVGYFPGFSASGQDVWLPTYAHTGEALVVSAVGSRCGRTFLASGRWTAIANTHVVWPLEHLVTGSFLRLYLDDEAFWLKGGSGQPFVQFRDSFARAVSLPSLQEQRAIARVLSDVDELIGSLEALIAKKRAIKQAVMRELLTGSTRLPGFGGEWEVATFDRLLKHHSGDSAFIKGHLQGQPGVGYFPGFSASGQDVWLPSYAHIGEALVVSAVGSRCGRTFLASGRWTAIANTHVVWPVEDLVAVAFLRLYLDDEAFWLKGGSGQPFVQFRDSFARAVSLPSVPEQKAIATVLSDMSGEVVALEHRLEKARAIKQGVIQQLLTGSIRLPTPDHGAEEGDAHDT